MNFPPESHDIDVDAVAEAFSNARKNHTALTEFPGGSIPASIELGYKIQAKEIEHWNDELVGWKVGGVPPQLQEKYGQTRLAGPVFKQNLQYCKHGETVKVPVFNGGYSAVEAEYVFELGDLSTLPSTDVSLEQAITAINKVYMGYENASSPLSIGNDFGPLGPISDFGLNNGVIVGPELVNWSVDQILSLPITVNLNGEHMNTCPAKDGLDGPFGAVKFLIEFIKQNNYSTKAGVLVSSGALTGVHKAFPGDKAEVIFADKASFNVELVDSKDF